MLAMYSKTTELIEIWMVYTVAVREIASQAELPCGEEMCCPASSLCVFIARVTTREIYSFVSHEVAPTRPRLT